MSSNPCPKSTETKSDIAEKSEVICVLYLLKTGGGNKSSFYISQSYIETQTYMKQNGKCRGGRRRKKMKLKKKNKVSFGSDIAGVNENETQSEIEMVSTVSGDERASIYSMSNGILPALGAESTGKLKLNNLIISPFNPVYRFVFSFLCMCFLFGLLGYEKHVSYINTTFLWTYTLQVLYQSACCSRQKLSSDYLISPGTYFSH